MRGFIPPPEKLDPPAAAHIDSFVEKLPDTPAAAPGDVAPLPWREAVTLLPAVDEGFVSAAAP